VRLVNKKRKPQVVKACLPETPLKFQQGAAGAQMRNSGC
jgi:hypothetical protein